MNKKIAALGILAMASIGFVACSATAEGGSTPPSGSTPTVTTSSSSAPAAAPSKTADAAPTLADLDGTWCDATDTSKCMTIANGATTDGASVTERTDNEGAPCLTAGISDSGGGFVVYYCPAGVTPATPVETDAKSTLNLNNQKYERLFATQAPPYVGTWYREADLAQAVAAG